MAYCKANPLDCNGFCNRFDAPCIKKNCRFFGVKTNADCIRAMSDEELAQFLNTRGCPSENHSNCFEMPCKHCWEKWLKQPAEEQL